MNEAWLALIGSLLGASGLKFIEHWLSRSKVKDDSAAQFRNELREEVKRIKEENRANEQALDEWRIKYFAVLEELSTVKRERDAALDKIQKAADYAVGEERHAPTTRAKNRIQDARNVAKEELGDG